MNELKDIHIRMPPELVQDIDRIAKRRRMSRNELLVRAAKALCDDDYTDAQNAELARQVAELMAQRLKQTETAVNGKTNELIRSLAAELYIIQRIVQENLDVTGQQIDSYRADGVRFLKSNHRIFKMKQYGGG